LNAGTLGRGTAVVDVFQIKALCGLRLPSSHVHSLLDPSDPIHDACDFLRLASSDDRLNFEEVNTRRHHPDTWNTCPPHLVAFASNGCGDYFAYDTRVDPPTIVYIDPAGTPEESVGAEDALTYKTFVDWRASRLENHAEFRP